MSIPGLPSLPQTTELASKSSLLPENETFQSVALAQLRKQTVQPDGKGDLVVPENTNVASFDESGMPVTGAKKKGAKDKLIHIEPASVNLKAEQDVSAKAVKKLALAKVATSDNPNDGDDAVVSKAKRKQTRPSAASSSPRKTVWPRCLFRGPLRIGNGPAGSGQGHPEPRQGPGLSQVDLRGGLPGFATPQFLPVLLRLRRPSGRREEPGRLGPLQAHRAKGDQRRREHGTAMSTATNYHADYVKPRWARSMRKLVKIGSHIFYSDG